MNEQQRELLLDKFLSRVDDSNVSGCWPWIGYSDKRGYGRFDHGKSRWQAHRLSYELLKGEIQDGMDVHHKCGNPLCCNPNHLEILGHDKHTSFHRASIMHCRMGHPLYGPNMRHENGKRRCRECHRLACARYRNKKVISI